jgi:hypothetical protein
VRLRDQSAHMRSMTDFIRYRETVEYTIALPRDDHEADEMYGEGDRQDVKVISNEEIGRHHEPDYALGTDMDAELFFLLKDDVRIFESRSHDAVVDHYGSLSDDVSRVFRFGDLEDQDKFWRVNAEGKAAAKARKAAEASARGVTTDQLLTDIMEGKSPVDEAVPITSADINRQTAGQTDEWSK